MRAPRFLASLLLGLSLAACDQTTTPGTPDAAAATGPFLKVTYQGTDHNVDLSKLAPIVADAGTRSVALSDVVLSALPGKNLATLKVGFRGSDGFDPASKSTCVGVVPLAGNLLVKGTVDLATLNELFLQIQPAHLQKLHGERLTGEQRSIERAAFIRARLHTN